MFPVPLRRLCVWFLVLLLGVPAGAPARAAGEWAGGPQLEEAVRVLRAAGIVQGDPDGGLRLRDPLTRAELVKLLVAASGQGPAAAGEGVFPDVEAGFWAAGYIAAARSAGLVSGYEDGTFRPRRPVSVAEVVRLTAALAGLAPDGADWPGAWLRAGARAGVVPPEAGLEADAGRPATRAEAFLLLHRALQVAGGPGANPVRGVPAKAEPAAAGQAGSAGPAAAAPADGAPGRPARLLAPAELQVRAGEAVPVDVRVLDEQGRELPGVAVVGQSDIGVWEAAGARTFRPYGSAGQGTLTLSVPGVAPVRVRVQVLPGPVAVLDLVGSRYPRRDAVAEFRVGSAMDAFKNPVAMPPEEIRWSVEPPDAAEVGAGGRITFRRSGDFTVVARAGQAEGRLPVHVSGPFTGVRIKGPDGELVANGETEYELEVRAVDAAGVPVAGYELEMSLVQPLPPGVTLTHVDPAVRDGVRRYRIRVEGVPRTVVLTARAEDRAAASRGYVEGSARFTVAAPKAAALELVPARRHLGRNGGLLPVEVRVVDQAGAPLRQATREVHLKVTGPATVTPAAVTYSGSTGAQVILSGTGGTGEVTLTASAYRLPEASVTVTALDVGAPAALVLSSPMAGKFINPAAPAPYNGARVMIQAVDANGIPVAGPASVTVTMARPSGEVKIDGRPAGEPVQVPLNPVTGSGSLRVEVGRYGGEILLVAAAPGLAEGRVALYATAQPRGVTDPAAQAGFLVPRELRARPGEAVAARLQVLDAAGLGTSNPRGRTVTLTADPGLEVNGAGGRLTVLPNRYGIADIELRAMAAGTYRVHIGGGELPAAAGMEAVTLVVEP